MFSTREKTKASAPTNRTDPRPDLRPDWKKKLRTRVSRTRCGFGGKTAKRDESPLSVGRPSRRASGFRRTRERESRPDRSRSKGRAKRHRTCRRLVLPSTETRDVVGSRAFDARPADDVQVAGRVRSRDRPGFSRGPMNRSLAARPSSVRSVLIWKHADVAVGRTRTSRYFSRGADHIRR